MTEKILGLLGTGVSAKEICEQYGIPRSTLYRWKKLHQPLDTSTDESITLADYHSLQRKLIRLELEKQVFSQSRCTLDAPLEDKVKEIIRLHHDFPLTTLCDVLKVNRSTAKNYIYRNRYPTKTQLLDEKLRNEIGKIFNESEQRFGEKKIKIKLEKLGLTVSRKKVQRLMHEMNLRCNRAKPTKKYPPERDRQYNQNHLKRKFTQAQPNSAWVSDITYYKVGDACCFICVVIDLFSRMVLSYEVSTSQTTSITTATFLDAFVKRGMPENLTFHSDQGAQYISDAFQKRLDEYGVRQSFSKPGCPYDNAVAETFFATLKKEELHRSTYTTISELSAAVTDYIKFFNEERPHQSLKYLTPLEMEQQYTAN